MIWTLIAFGITLLILRKLAFPQIAEALDMRQRAIEEAIDHADATKAEADQLLADYRARLKEARVQADEIVSKAKPNSDAETAASLRQGQGRAGEPARAPPSATSSRPRRRRSAIFAARSLTSRSRPPRRSPRAPYRRRSAAPRRRGAGRAGLLDPRRAGGINRGSACRGLRALALRGRAEAGQDRGRPRAARAVRRRARGEPRAPGVLLLPVLLHQGEDGGAAQGASSVSTRPCRTSSSC